MHKIDEGIQKKPGIMIAARRLVQFCKRYMPAIIIALIAAAGGTVLTIIGPDKLGEMSNVIMAGIGGVMDIKLVWNLAAILILFYSLSALLSFLQSWIMATVTQRVCQKLRSRISGKLSRLPLKYFDKVSFGDVLSRVTNDVDTIGQSLNQSVPNLITAVTMFIGSLIMMFKTSWIMALTAILSTTAGFGLMLLLIGKSQRFFTAQQDELGNINGHTEEIYSGHNVVKAYNGGRAARREFDAINDRLCDSAWKAQFISGLMQPLMGFIGNFGYVAVCVTGAALTLNGTISFGVIVAFMMYVRFFTQPLQQIAQAFTSLQQTAAASARVFELLDESEVSDESRKAALMSDVRGDVEFQRVQFGYSPDRLIINDFSAAISAGQKVAIVGPTGAGKTTLVNVLMRFYELNGGSILLDGKPISDTTRENLRDQFCMVLQDTWIFEGTVRENIVYSKANVSDAEVESVCRKVGLNHFIGTLPDGYDTVLSDSINLSAGQRQLITIARAMIQNAPLLILDEATSSVDTRTELIIQKAIDELTKGRTSFVIAHRLSTIRNADVILVMKDGDIIESGNHDELMARGGFYAELYNSQFDQAA